MTDPLRLPDPDVRALVAGEVILAFPPRFTAQPGDEVELEGGGPRPTEDLKPAYRRWSRLGPPPGRWWAMVEAVHPAAALHPERGDARHHLAAAPVTGDLVVLRVYGAGGDPVLSDDAYAGRRRSLDAALG